MAETSPAVLDVQAVYPLHKVGWKAFQDLCAAVAEECLQRPVQTFLPTNDAGRDGAFVGRWEEPGPAAGQSTIQCKFTSDQEINLSLSMLGDELEKAEKLAAAGLADDYIIMTNHPVTGASEMAIKVAFEARGVQMCRVFHGPWISDQIRKRPRLRMMVPRLYGLGDLSDVLDARAYAQAQLILSEMGDNLQKLVVTEAHRRSVKAISEFNFVLLLGSPASGKSTIGASLAVGAADTWSCATIKSTSPEHLQQHLNPNEPQFFWVDDAWGSTQYRGDRTEAWNQVFPLIHAAMHKGTRFLITSRDYIWRAALRDLKLQALPVLKKSQVIIDVHKLSLEEKACILYNHVKLGDQDTEFVSRIKPILPDLAARDDFLPESARRLGNKFFTTKLLLTPEGVTDFFSRPREFLEETIESLSPASKAAIALVFLNGGKARSPVPREMLSPAADAFGVAPAELRVHLEALQGSILLLPHDELGPYWTYKHPTVGDAFAAHVARSPELVGVYLRGASPESILGEVVCAGVQLHGAPVVVPTDLNNLLVERIANGRSDRLRSFIVYRANPDFAAKLVSVRPDLLDGISWLYTPLRENANADFLVALGRLGLLPAERRQWFVDEIRTAVVESADASFIEDDALADFLTDDEHRELLQLARIEVLDKVDHHISRVSGDWDSDNDPDDHFYYLQSAIEALAERLLEADVRSKFTDDLADKVRREKLSMEERYTPPVTSKTKPPSAPQKSSSLDDLFRDVDE